MDNFDLKKYLAEGRLKETFVKLSDEQKAKVIAAAKRGEAPEDVIDSDFDGDDKYLQSVKALMDKSKLNEAMLDVTTTEKIAQAVADAFTAEDNELDLRYTVTPGTSERSFDLDVERGPNTPDEDSLGQDIENYLGDYAGGSFYIKDGVVYNAAMRNAPVANVTPEGGIEMISAEDSRDAIGMVDGEKTDYMERRREMSDYMEEGKDEDYDPDLDQDDEEVPMPMDDEGRPLGESKKEKKSNKMKKSELKEMIKAAMLNETLVDADQDMADAILNALGGEEAFEALVRAMSTDDAQTYLGAIMRDYDIEMRGPVGDIPGFEGTMDALDSLSIREEKKEDKEEEEVEVEDEEIDVDLDQEEVDMDMDMDMEDRGRVGLTGDKKVVDDSLEAALEAARALGDEKLVDQIGNTITFFTRSQIVKETINKEKMLQEVKRMQRIAGIIK